MKLDTNILGGMVHMVGYQMPLDDFHALIAAQLPEYLRQRVPILIADSLWVMGIFIL